jgi:pimeloyl-ACP methyl ester carboxylesterase
LALDYRGRGRSDYDRDPSHYNVAMELADVIAVMTACAAIPAVIVGTSRGGLLAMLLGAVHPAMIAGVVLNDIGPAIELNGLMRIKASIGKTPEPRDFHEAVEILKSLHSTQFPKLTPEQWLAFAHRTWHERDGRLIQTYDPNLAVTLASVDAENPLPSLWKEFDALGGVPMMVIRGETSDILSRETVSMMRARRPDLELIEIPDQGHTPLLAEEDVIGRIADFVSRCER